MHRKFPAGGMALASAIALLVSCSKPAVSPQPPVPGTSLTAQARLSGGGPDDAANPANPYDSVGYYHNYALQDTRATWTKPGVTKAECYDSLVSWLTANDFPVTMTGSEINSMVASIRADTAADCANFVGATNLSTAAKGYANSIFALGRQLSSYPDYDDYKAAVIAIETQLTADAGVSASDKMRVLCAASVARHSVLYWAREANGDNADPTTSYNPCAKPFWDRVKKWWNDIDWFNVGICDVGGAVTGIVGGPLGIVCGAIGGSIIGTTVH